jgi:hypothetical protein
MNQQTQLCKSNILAHYLFLLHVSAVYISHHQVGISSQKEQKRERPVLTNIGIKWYKIIGSLIPRNSHYILRSSNLEFIPTAMHSYRM